MTRWAIVADLNRCVGCQTCTSACKHTNATGPWVQWRKVLDFEVGEYPDVSRAFVPVGCMHCEEPSCMEVCPTTATRKRDDGIVTIDYDICIGCTYCIQACPYQARFKVDIENEVYGHGRQMGHELKREDWARKGVAQKCTLCSDRIDYGLANGLTPGVDEMATPSCVASCISGALTMGDLDDPDSDVSKLLVEKRHFRMHEELGNGPGFYYLFDQDIDDTTAISAPPMVESPVGMGGLEPQLQSHWDWRAAGNFAFGGTGSGLMIATMLAGLFAPVIWTAAFIAMLFVATGLFFVWLEIGRPLRFLNVYRNPQTSWMAREAYVVMPFFAFGGLAWLLGSHVLGLVAAIFAAGFLYAQARVLRAAKAIPAWRLPAIVPLISATGLAEGVGLLAVFDASLTGVSIPGLPWVLLGLILARSIAWRSYRATLGEIGAPTKAFLALDKMPALGVGPQGVLAGLALYAGLHLSGFMFVLLLAGLGSVIAGWMFKYTLITKAAFNQGYAITRMPARGAGQSIPGVQPGWKKG